MEMKIEEEKFKQKREQDLFWAEYLSRVYSQLPKDGEKPEFTRGRQKFVDTIKPKDGNKAKAAPKKFDWNIPQEVLEKSPLYLVEKVKKGG